jgi:hypothetical protein
MKALLNKTIAAQRESIRFQLNRIQISLNENE